MKLRIRDNSLRFRLDQKDVDSLRQHGQVESTTQFTPDANLLIRVVRRAQTPLLMATLELPIITLWVRGQEAQEWAENTETGLADKQNAGDATLRLLLEKDYPCLQEREGESDEYAFAWPASSQAKAHACA